MAAFELHYPDETTPTVSWTPSAEPEVNGTKQTNRRNVLQDVMADGFTVHSTKTGSSFREYEERFLALTGTDKANFETFADAVLGETFKLLDPNTAGAYVSVKFALGALDEEWTPLGNAKWSVTLRFRAA